MQKQTIRIGFTESDLDDLRSGYTHNWTFPTDKGDMIDVELFNEDIEGSDEEE